MVAENHESSNISISFLKKSRPAYIATMIILGLLAVWVFINAIVMISATFAILPAFLNSLTIVPIRSLVTLLLYLGATGGWIVAGVILVLIERNLIKKEDISRKNLFILLSAAAVIILCHVLMLINLPLYIGI